jgi:hypothetical protein
MVPLDFVAWIEKERIGGRILATAVISPLTSLTRLISPLAFWGRDYFFINSFMLLTFLILLES